MTLWIVCDLQSIAPMMWGLRSLIRANDLLAGSAALNPTPGRKLTHTLIACRHCSSYRVATSQFKFQNLRAGVKKHSTTNTFIIDDENPAFYWVGRQANWIPVTGKWVLTCIRVIFCRFIKMCVWRQLSCPVLRQLPWLVEHVKPTFSSAAVFSCSFQRQFLW